MDIAAAITATTQALGLAKTIRDVDKAFDQALLKSEMVEIMSKLSDVKLALIEAAEELHSKEREIEKLRAVAKFKADETVSLLGFRYCTGEDGKPIGRPFCSRCDQVDGILVSTIRDPQRPMDLRCPNCATKFDAVAQFPG